MDSISRIGESTPYQGGAPRQRPGDTGGFARRRRPERERPEPEFEPAHDQAPPDPLLAEMDRLRALEPQRGDSGARRALQARKAYAPPPERPGLPEFAPTDAPPLADAASAEATTAVYRPPPTAQEGTTSLLRRALSGLGLPPDEETTQRLARAGPSDAAGPASRQAPPPG